MVLGWRRAFCTSVPKDGEPIIKDKSEPKLSSRFGGFFSNPSTPRLQSQPVSSPNLRCKTSFKPQAPPPAAAVSSCSAPQSPRLECKTKNSSRFFRHSEPSSPRSPSTFSRLKSSLRLSKSRCVICLQGVKTGQGTAIFTAECGHSFHFPCITAHVKKQGTLTCPICNSIWKEMHLLDTHDQAQNADSNSIADKTTVLKVYNDDEPLSSPTSGARFNTIPESDETEEENDEFPGFFRSQNVVPAETQVRKVEVALLSDAAAVSVGKTSETYAVVMKIKAPAAPLRRAPIDLVTVLNVSRNITLEKLQLMKRAMRLVVSSLSAADRLSIVAYSTTSKRLLPLRRMSSTGKRSARRIIDAVVSLDTAAGSASDSLKKAAKVLDDRREENPTASIILFTDGHRSSPTVSTTRFQSSDVPVHSVSLSACLNAPPEENISKCIGSLLSVVIQDLRIQIGSGPSEIAAVYAYAGRPSFIGSGSNWCRVGDFHSGEERELLIELKMPLPSSFTGSHFHRLLSVRCSYRDPSTQQPIYDKELPLPIPRPPAVGASTRDIQRLRCLFITTRAVAESRRLAERNSVAAAHHMLASARALVLQSSSGSGDQFVRRLEAEMMELNSKRQDQLRRRNNHERETVMAEDKAEPLTPTSAWRAAERLAKVAITRKSLNRVSDLHGFENARF